MLAINPKYSLTTNVGFGKDATHTSRTTDPKEFIAQNELTFPLEHPKFMAPYLPFEKAYYKQNNTWYEKAKHLLPFKLKMKIKEIIK